jgi:hypothetical protein
LVHQLRIMFDQIPPEQLAILAREDQGPRVIGLVVTFTVLAFICVLLRFFARIKFTRLLGWEDFFIALSMVLLKQTYIDRILLMCTLGFFNPYGDMSNQTSGMG